LTQLRLNYIEVAAEKGSATSGEKAVPPENKPAAGENAPTA
jgi:hypothetical protein